MSQAIQGLIYCYLKNRDYGQKLVSDLNSQQMVVQPVPDLVVPTNHPAWVFSHLNLYLGVIMSLIEDVDFPDPREQPFGMLSKPENDSSIYPSKEELVDTFISGHDRVIEILSQADDQLLERPMRLLRWQPIMPTLGIALPYLMLNHENSHLGQISTWRRVQGLPSV